MKKFCFVFIIFSLFVFAGCGGSNGGNKNDEPDSGETVTDEDGDTADDSEPSEPTDTEPDNPDTDDPDTEPTEKPDQDKPEPKPDDDADTTPEPKPDDDADTTPEENDDDADSGIVEPTEEEKCAAFGGTFNADGTCTRTQNCDPIPETAGHTEWVGESSYTQTYTNGEWVPVYTTDFLSANLPCHYRCAAGYDWNSDISSCVNPCDSKPCLGIANSTGECTAYDGVRFSCSCENGYEWVFDQWNSANNKCEKTPRKICEEEGGDYSMNACTKTTNCDAFTDEHAQWNGASSYTQQYDFATNTWSAAAVTEYSETEGTCHYKCAADYYMHDGSCQDKQTICNSVNGELSELLGQYLCTKDVACDAKPENSQWNGASSYPIAYSFANDSWVEKDVETVYDEEMGSCHFTCEEGFGWDNENCTQEAFCTSNGGIWNATKELCTCATGYFWSGTTCEELPECSATSGAPCKDSTTELIWSEKSADNMHLKWEDEYPAQDYCENLTEGGYADWHLPNINELRTLILNCDGTVYGGACAVSAPDHLSYFNDWTNADCYSCSEDLNGNHSKFGDTDWLWSISTVSSNTGSTWGVGFSRGQVGYYSNNANYKVRCVRTETEKGECFAAGKFWVDSQCLPKCSPGSLFPCYDPESRNIWSEKADEQMKFKDSTDPENITYPAQAHCESLNASNYGGFNRGWHLPTIDELRTLILECEGSMPNGDCAISDPDHLSYDSDYVTADCRCDEDTSGGHSKFGETGVFWSSSARSDSTTHAWYVNFTRGWVSNTWATNSSNVRCVRSAE